MNWWDVKSALTSAIRTCGSFVGKPLCATLKVFGTVYTPPDKTRLEFDQWQKTIPPKFIVYADFEPTLEKPADADDNDEETRTVLQVHMPVGAGALTLGPQGGSGSYTCFYGENCVVKFMRHLESKCIGGTLTTLTCR